MPRSARNHDCSLQERSHRRFQAKRCAPTSLCATIPASTARRVPSSQSTESARSSSTHFKIKLPSLYKAILTRSCCRLKVHVAVDRALAAGRAAERQRATVRPTALRLYRSDDKPEEPEHRVYDVYGRLLEPAEQGQNHHRFRACAGFSTVRSWGRAPRPPYHVRPANLPLICPTLSAC